jgi:hypothetical protein
VCSSDLDTTIYYFDLSDTSKNKAFKIRTPAYDVSDTKTALYANSLSFDPTGEYLLFDAYNHIHGAAGDSLDFWSINLLNVRTGTMEGVFPPLSKGINVGNPSFSRTSPTRFAFDYIDTKQNRFAVMAADFESNKVGIVADSNGTVGYPTYSADDRIIAYHSISFYNSALHDVLWTMPLASDLISGTGSPQAYLGDATFPVWFVIGQRVTAVNDRPVQPPRAFSLRQNYPNPFNPTTNLQFSIANLQFVSLKVYDMLGREAATLVNEMKQPGEYSVTWDAGQIPSGVYFYRLTAGSRSETKKLLLMK